MKLKWFTLIFLVLVAVVFQMPAQQSEADRKLFQETKAKAERGDAEAQNKLGLCYGNGVGVAKDYVEAVKWHRKAAEQNDAKAQYTLGWCYANGLGVSQDSTEAVKWYRKAAEQNLADAQFHLGVCYENGYGVAKDEMEAVKWYRKAAEQKLAPAQFNLGNCYVTGSGVAKDHAEAIKWFREAADQGHAKAQNNLGACYEHGWGVSVDVAEASKWYRKAAEQNSALAQFNLGALYGNGEGVNKDAAEAVKCYRKAAEQNLAQAQYSLGAAYPNGDGVPKDYLQAYKWINLASAQGDELAKKFLPVIERRMTTEQIAEAQRLAREFKPRKESSSDNSISPENPTASGSGFFITDDGYLITNEHVVKDAAQVRLVTSAGLISARVVKVDAANDLALLKAEGRFAALPIAPSRAVKLGGTVATVGFPNIGLQGFAPKFARGEIASLSGAGDDARYFQISVPVQPGNSGGALVEERGNVVGVVSAKLDAAAALSASGALPENVNYAVKSGYLLSFLESVPEVSAKLKEASGKEIKFEEVVEKAKQAAVLVLVY